MFFPCEFVYTRRSLFLINSFSYIFLVLSYAGLSSSDVLFFFFLQVHPRMGVLSLEFVLDRRCSLLWIFLPLPGISQVGALTSAPMKLSISFLVSMDEKTPSETFAKDQMQCLPSA